MSDPAVPVENCMSGEDWSAPNSATLSSMLHSPLTVKILLKSNPPSSWATSFAENGEGDNITC